MPRDKKFLTHLLWKLEFCFQLELENDQVKYAELYSEKEPKIAREVVLFYVNLVE